MTGFAALGCNPDFKSTTLSDFGGVPLGTLAYSPGGGIFVLFRANGAIQQYGAVTIDGASYDASPTAQADNHGLPVCIPQTALANNEIGWGLICGGGKGHANSAVSAGDPVSIGATAGDLDDATSNNLGPAVWQETTSAEGGADIWVAFPSIIT